MQPIPRKKADSIAVPETVYLSYDSVTDFLIPHLIFFLLWLGHLDTGPREAKRKRRKDTKAFLP